ncbi:YwqJ-related putative deaminase [Streptomyces sp. L-9-10]|uniref:YwqJ-related putative deaminase n=1 Tax=Streptomyces sp. L-9-10 TaxID=1478131 RepID=UPI001877B401|nr:YwqJ-related putative deaminase [Streptomyces sp. L-9-10]
MADALREFADDAEDDGAAANQYIQKLLSTGRSESLTALDEHWSKVQGKHKDLAKASRIIAGALDRVADIIVARKIAAVGELADLCATVGVTLAFAPVTAGLSTLLAGAKIAATRIAFKRILKEMAEAAVAEIVATLTQPAVAAIENVVADLAIQTALNVTGVRDGYRTDQTVKAGVEGLRLNSADGPTGPVPGGDLEIDHDAHGSTGMHLANVQISMQGKTKAKIGKAKGAHGRARGKDSLTAALDTTIDGVTEKLDKALDDLGDHVGKKLPDAIKGGSKAHRDADADVRDQVGKGGKGDGDDLGKGGSGDGGHGGGGSSGSGSGGGRPLQPPPGWHGRSAGRMRHHRGDALDVSGLDQQQRLRLLEHEARDLADAARDARGQQPEGKDRLQQGCSGALVHGDVLTSHSSSQGRHGQKTPDTHPVLRSVYDELAARADRGELVLGRGHGKCAEVSLISDRLHDLDDKHGSITTIEDARRAMSGSKIYTVAIGDQQDGDGNVAKHGSYLPPCRSCGPALEALGIGLHS